MKISRYIKREHIIFLNAAEKKQVLRELWAHTEGNRHVKDRDELLRKLYEREKLMSTGIGLGIGVPHVKLESITDFVVVIGISRAGLEYSAFDNQKVHIVIMVAAPAAAASEYLKLLAKIVSELKEGETRERIIRAAGPEEVLDVFRDK